MNQSFETYCRSCTKCQPKFLHDICLAAWEAGERSLQTVITVSGDTVLPKRNCETCKHELVHSDDQPCIDCIVSHWWQKYEPKEAK